jgi:hypothetical protein
MKKTKSLVPVAQVQSRIFVIRGINVMLSSDLAQLYGVEVKVLNQAVKRNTDRFPADFMFQLTLEEFGALKSQIVTSSWGGLRRALPKATGSLLLCAWTQTWVGRSLEKLNPSLILVPTPGRKSFSCCYQ